MSEKTIRVVHEVNTGDLSRLENALKGLGSKGEAASAVNSLNKMVAAQDKLNKEKKEELGIVGKLKQEQRELRKAQDYPKTQKELDAVNKRLRKVGKELKKAKDTTSTWTKALGSFQFKFNALGNIAANVASSISRNFTLALRQAVKTVVEFEAAMAGVRAISGATKEEFKRLSDEAIRLGGATIFTARQVAELQINYAKLGFSVDEINNVTEATLSLAAATDEGLAKSALIAGSTLRAFGYEAIQMQRIIDVMAVSFTSSALTLELWGESMKFSGSIMKTAGLDIEQAAGALQVLADRSIKGSIAGNAMKNILLRMVDANSALSKSTGIVVKNNEDFIRVLEILKERNVDLTEVLEYSDKRSVNALNILINTTEALKDNAEAARLARGAAQEMAEIRMDTLAGSITILKSAWEGLILSAEQGTNALTVGARYFIDSITRTVVGLKEMLYTMDQIAKNQGIEEAKKDVEDFMISIRAANLDLQLNAAKHRQVYYQAVVANLQSDYDELMGKGDDYLEKLSESEEELIRNYERARKEVELLGIELLKISQIQKEQANSIALAEATTLAYLKLMAKNRKQFGDAVADYEYQLAVEKIKELGYSLDIETELIEEAERARLLVKKKYQIAWLKEMAVIDSARAKIYNKQIQALEKSITNIGRLSRIDLLERDDEKGIEKAGKRTLVKGGGVEGTLFSLVGLDGKDLELAEAYVDEAEAIFGKFAEILRESFEEGDSEGDKDKIRDILEDSYDFAMDILDDINDAEIRLLDQQVDRMDTRISELQRSLDEEYELRREGKANRVALIEDEIRIEQERREAAYRKQEVLEKKKRLLQSLTQVSNLVTATTEIWRWAAQTSGPYGVPVAILATGVMLGTFVSQLASINSSVPKYAEGGWVDGKPHSQGGTRIEAEGGEFVVRKDRASVFGDILESLNDDGITQAWDTINGVTKKGNNINILTSSKSTDELLKELIQVNKEAPKDFGDYIEFEYKGTKYRVKK